MSHFTKLNIQIKRQEIAKAICKQFGWTQEHADVYENPYTPANEKITDCTLYKDSQKRVKMAVMKNGDVVHDWWSMGNDANKFLVKYSEEYIKRTATREGARVVNQGVDENGDTVLEIQYLC